MNKVVSFLSGALSILLSIFLIGCKAPSGGGSDSNTNYNYLESHGGMGGAVASSGIKIGNNPMLDNTSEVYAIAPGNTGYFNGSSGHTDVPENADAKYKGVFLKNRKVELSPFIIGQYEVTQELYESVMTNEKIGDKFLNATPSKFCDSPAEGEFQNLRPVEQVSWYDAVYFCNALSEKTNLEKAYVITNVTVDEDGHIIYADVEMDITKTGYRLPTEAEWEFAARGGDPTKSAWDYTFSGAPKANGSNYTASKNAGLDTVGWYLYNTTSGSTGNSGPSSGGAGWGTHQVGKKNANALGIFDMSGNVWEWCYDWSDTILTGSETDPVGTASGSYRVSRGGSWYSDACYCAVSNRSYSHPSNCDDYLGFRVVRNAN